MIVRARVSILMFMSALVWFKRFSLVVFDVFLTFRCRCVVTLGVVLLSCFGFMRSSVSSFRICFQCGLCVDVCGGRCLFAMLVGTTIHVKKNTTREDTTRQTRKTHHRYLPHDQLHDFTLRQHTTHTTHTCWLCILSSVVFMRLCLLCVVLVC